MALSSPLSLTLLNRTSSLNNRSLGVIKSYNVLPSTAHLALITPHYVLSSPPTSFPYIAHPALTTPQCVLSSPPTSFPYIAHPALITPHCVLSLASSTIVG